MHLDTNTLLSVGCLMAALSAILIGGAWTQLRESVALLWWSAAFAVNSAAIGTLAVGLNAMTTPVINIGTALGALSPMLIWAGVRRFEHRRVPLVALAVLAAATLALGLFPGDDTWRKATAVFFFASRVFFLIAAAWNLWRGRGEHLWARWPLMALFAVHSLTFVGGIHDTVARNLANVGPPPLASWFGAIYLESLIYTMAAAVFLIGIARERGERQLVAAGRRDSLTGIANRGALLNGGQRLLQRCQQEGMSFSLIMFDLDHFKRVNDGHGHATGDEVLRAFAETALSFLRPSDLFGRYGGEEFVVVLPRATIEAAYVIADRIRNAFASAPVVVSGSEVRCTVSAGVASAGSDVNTIEEILKVADTCLYRAKELGRNRVERAPRPPESEGDTHVIRVA